MASAVEFLAQLEVNVDTQAVLRIQGYRGDGELKAGIREITTRQVEAARQLATPRAIYREVQVLGIDDGTIMLEDGLLLHVGATIARWWHGSHSLAVALCTIGGALEERVMALSKNGDRAEALVLDIAGSVALGSATDQVRRFICEKASNQRIEVGPALNPGYREWPLTDQRLIFTLMPAEDIGVRLNDQFMMVPKKSVSFCAGLGVTETTEDFNRCNHCGVSKCLYRRVDKQSKAD